MSNILRTDEGPKLMNLPGNSFKDKEKSERREEIKQIIKGKVIEEKQPLSSKFKDAFLGDNVTNIKEYIIKDVILPSVKNLLFDALSDGFDMINTGLINGFEVFLFGKSNRQPKNKKSNVFSSISYGNFFKNNKTSFSSNDTQRSSLNINNIILETKLEAEEVIFHLSDLINYYGFASVADLYDLVGITPEYTYNKYGWSDSKGFSISRIRKGYLLNLPRAKVLE